MAVTLVNPDGLPTVDVYRQVAITSGTRLVLVAGQVAHDADGKTVGRDDLTAQVERAYLNVGIALAAAGGSFADVARLTFYVVGWSVDRMPELLAGIDRAAEALGERPYPPASLIGVQALATPELLVEIEATAVLD
ncbi:RidA family protein [Streptomyces sp. NPDC006798]|uniref:RidA family protein n=1 Tax=Streptomyces sp. NPDC006798 TaxID=3155462 RepID=UPI003411C00F